MNPREPILPLIVGLAASLCLHVLAAPILMLLMAVLGMAATLTGSPTAPSPGYAAALSMRDAAQQPPPVPKPVEKQAPALPPPPTPLPAQTPPPPEPQKQTIPVGKDDGDPIITASWIPYEDFQKLIAPEADNEQPAVQAQAQPTPQAPARADASPDQGKAHDEAMRQVQGHPQDSRPSPAVAVAMPQPTRPVALPPTPDHPPMPEAEQPQQARAAPLPPRGLPDMLPGPRDPQATDRETTETQLARPAVSPPATLTGTPPIPEAELAMAPDPVQDSLAAQKAQPEVKEQKQAPRGDEKSREDRPEPRQAGTPPSTQEPESPAQGEQLALAAPRPTPPLPQAVQEQEAPPSPQPSPPQPAARQGDDRQADTHAAGSSNPQPKPTSSPRSDRESPPVSLTPDGPIKVVPGRVITGQGIEIKPAVPRISVIAQSTIIPQNPSVKLTFDRQGQVIAARFVKGTGYENWDGPILASLYKWKASGKRLEEIDGEFDMDVELIFVK
ncbi:MAG: hypothetical protein WD042_13215 [Phycisphaeraceae bacterium]